MITLTIICAVTIDLPLHKPYTRVLEYSQRADAKAYRTSQKSLGEAIRTACVDAGHYRLEGRRVVLPDGPFVVGLGVRSGGLKTRRGVLPRMDGDNLLKAIPDAMKTIGLIDDDGLERFRAGWFAATIDPDIAPGVHRATVYIARGVEVRHDRPPREALHLGREPARGPVARLRTRHP